MFSDDAIEDRRLYRTWLGQADPDYVFEQLEALTGAANQSLAAAILGSHGEPTKDKRYIDYCQEHFPERPDASLTDRERNVSTWPGGCPTGLSQNPGGAR